MIAPQLNSSEAADLAQRISELSAAGLPLAPGLRAAADDAASTRLAGVLRMLADELERGTPLDDALGTLDRHLPAYVQGTVRAGVRSGKLAEVLLRLVEADRSSRQLRREIRLAVAYPVILVALIACLLAFIMFVILPAFRPIFKDFETELPAATEMMLGVSDQVANLTRQPAWLTLGILVVALIVGPVVLRCLEWLGWQVLPATAARSLARMLAPLGNFLGWLLAWPLRILATAPLVGPLYFWHAIAEWSRLLALLVDARVPLPDAIELAAHGVRSAALARAMPPIAAGVRQGHSLAQLIAHSFWMPASLGPLVEWGEKTGQLGEALRTAAEMFDGRIRLRATLLKQIFPPILFLLVASCLALIVAAIFGPLVRLIQTLS